MVLDGYQFNAGHIGSPHPSPLPSLGEGVGVTSYKFLVLTNYFKSTILINQNSVVAQLRPLTQLNTTNKDNAAKLAIDPYAGEFEGRRIRPSILGGSGGETPRSGFSPHNQPQIQNSHPLTRLKENYS
jgi:hypothetical protein